MAFQFLCPEGHLLQGHESQAGQRCKCPYCSVEFLVPQPPGEPAAVEAAVEGTPPPTADYQPAEPYYEEPTEPDFPGIRTGHGGEDPAAVSAALPAAQEQPLVHILCPNGHELETPREMLGQDAMCPYCQAVFRLRFEDSVEHRRQVEEERERREIKLGRAWMYWSIAVASVVVLGVIILVVVAAST
jgi:DNA-directed RNA polymerase subunit RPC12/RpoP